MFREYAARREAERLKHEAELRRLRDERDRLAARQMSMANMDRMVGTELTEGGMHIILSAHLSRSVPLNTLLI